MPTKFRPITKSEKTNQIGIGLFIALIFAGIIGFIAPFIFQWIASFFDPVPDHIAECRFSDYLDKTISEYRTCKEQSNSYSARVERLSKRIPWFWILFVSFGWFYLRHPLKGQIRDDSDDIVYEGDRWKMFVTTVFLGPALLYGGIWALAVRDKLSFIILAFVVAAFIFCEILDRFFRKKYGMPKSEFES